MLLHAKVRETLVLIKVLCSERRVGAVLRSFGDSRDLREPDEIFHAVLAEGEEVSQVSGLKLCRRLIHKEPVIELCGAAPYKFAELRELGLVNEQISWKQRFFIPTDETTGTDILTALLDRYLVIATDDASIESEASTHEITPEIRVTNMVDLDQWVVPVENTNAVSQPVDNSDKQNEMPTPVLTVEPPPSALTHEVAISWTGFRLMPQSQLAFDFG